jgi:hypothetical protein
VVAGRPLRLDRSIERVQECQTQGDRQNLCHGGSLTLVEGNRQAFAKRAHRPDPTSLTPWRAFCSPARESGLTRKPRPVPKGASTGYVVLVRSVQVASTVRKAQVRCGRATGRDHPVLASTAGSAHPSVTKFRSRDEVRRQYVALNLME